MINDGVICIDFDDTIANSNYPGTGIPTNGVRDALLALQSLGYKIRIYSCRLNAQNAIEGNLIAEKVAIATFMAENNLPYDDMVMPDEGKPLADFYIDNKAVHYDGDWSAVVENITDRVAEEEEAAVVLKFANELKEGLNFNSRESLNLRPLYGISKPIVNALKKSANVIYKKFVRPHLDEIYDDEIEDDVEEWCKDNVGDVECEPPKEVFNKIVIDVKKELKDEITEKYFVHAFIDALKSINPINIVKTAYKALKKHGWKLGMKIALVIIIGDLIIPTMGTLLHPSLFGILSATPHTEIAIAAVTVGKGMDEEEALEFVEKYEEETGDDLVKDVYFK